MPIKHTATVFISVKTRNRLQLGDARSRLRASGSLGQWRQWHCSNLLARASAGAAAGP